MTTAERTITIPACVEHHGVYMRTATVPWVCIHCGGPRGEPHKVRSYDGSLSMAVDGWENPCGHVEKYGEIRDWLEKCAGVSG